MTTQLSRRLLALSLMVSALVLVGCVSTHVDSPLGTWSTHGEDEGTLVIDPNGSFTIENASFDPVRRAPAIDYDAAGTWVLGNPGTINFLFESSDGETEPTDKPTIPADFRSGSIRFEEPEQTVGITFYLRAETTAGPTS